jgi:Cdc6-like AAA superfamily ATPase
LLSIFDCLIHDLTTFTASSNTHELVTNADGSGEIVQALKLDRREREIRDWLSAPDPSFNYKNALEKRYEGTGSWFTGSQAFANWKKQPNSFIWLHGGPGYGKTVLSSTIIKHLKSVTMPAQILLYFYFNFNDVDKQTFESMLRSLINQLYQKQPDARGPLEQLWESSGKGQKQPSTKLLRDVLLAMLSKVNNVSIVLDALDESTTRSDLLTWLRDVHKAEPSTCRVLVTARSEEDIESNLQRWMLPESSMSIQKRDADGVIRAYIRHTVRNGNELRRWHRRPEVQDEIETELVNRAGGV